MGLLDNLFFGSNANFGGQGGGLLDLLRSTETQNNQYQPSAGFAPDQNPPATFADRFNAVPNAPPMFAGSARNFDSAQFDPSTYAPNQAQPIAVGNYQMPRIGNADSYRPPEAATLPPNAQPTQGQLPPQAPSTDISAQSRQPQQPLPPAFGGGGYMDRIANGGGLISSLFGDSGQQQGLRAQYNAIQQALIANGESPQAAASKAMVAVMNPEAAKTILPEVFTTKEKFHTIKDSLGREVPAFINERDQTINGKPIAEYNATATNTGLEAVQRARDAGVTGDALYAALPKEIGPIVKAMVEGRQPLPSTMAMRSPATLALIDAAHTIDPTFDATIWKARNEAGPDWSKGKSSEMVRAANQTLGHVDSLLNAMDALKNRAMPAWNAVANTVSEQFGSGEQTSFRINAHAVAEEMSKVFKGANLSDSEIRNWEQNLGENMSPTQQKAAIGKLAELLHGSLTALEKKRADALGPVAAAKAPPLIGEEGQKVLQRVDSWVKQNGAEQPKQSSGVDRSAIEAEMKRRGILK